MRQEETRPSLGREALASIVVFLVALPLCMGISLASGVSPALGLISGIIGGIVVGLLGGSPLQVSGPAAGLAVIVWELVQTHGIELLGPIVLTAGLIQLAAGLSRLGRHFRAIAPPVVYGMLAGIGVLITALDRITPGSDLHVHVLQLSHIDHACLDALATWEKQGERHGSTRCAWSGRSSWGSTSAPGDRRARAPRAPRRWMPRQAPNLSPMLRRSRGSWP